MQYVAGNKLKVTL